MNTIRNNTGGPDTVRPAAIGPGKAVRGTHHRSFGIVRTVMIHSGRRKQDGRAGGAA